MKANNWGVLDSTIYERSDKSFYLVHTWLISCESLAFCDFNIFLQEMISSQESEQLKRPSFLLFAAGHGG